MAACHTCSYRRVPAPRPGNQRCSSCGKPLCRIHKRKHEGKVLCPDCIHELRRKTDARIQGRSWE